MIIRCVCSHPEQDRLYGDGKRVHNRMKSGTPQLYRCTVCNRDRTKGGEKKVRVVTDVTAKKGKK